MLTRKQLLADLSRVAYSWIRGDDGQIRGRHNVSVRRRHRMRRLGWLTRVGRPSLRGLDLLGFSRDDPAAHDSAQSVQAELFRRAS